MNEYQAAYKIQKDFSIPTSTLRLWGTQGKIRFIRLSEGGKRYYHYSDVNKLFCQKQESKLRVPNRERTIIYARVCASQQKDDLDKQISILKSRYPEAKVIQDIDSSLNHKRKGLRSLLDKAHRKSFDKLVIYSRDRLCRFSFDLFKYIFKQQGIKIEVVSLQNNKNKGQIDIEQEMAQDLLAIVNAFGTGGNKGRRS